jgi:filamentous hemagglutinin family protein
MHGILAYPEFKETQPGIINSGAESGVETDAKKDEPDEEDLILCRNCQQVISHVKESINMNGLHQHAFANPEGIVFDIGCFKNAFGCGYMGSASSEFTWFGGYSWRIAVCLKCVSHLGWLFTSLDGTSHFHGLILKKLLTGKY